MNIIRGQCDELRREIKTLDRELKGKIAYLRALENGCHHDWGETITIPHRHEPYTIPASGGGVDRIPEMHVPAKTTYIYRRTCELCGKTEETDRIKEVPQKTKVEPQF